MQKVVYYFIFIVKCVKSWTSKETETERLLHENSWKYEPMWDRIERLGAPKFKPDGQTNVEMTLMLESISSVNEAKLDIELMFNLELIWEEPLLKFVNISNRRNFGSGRNLLTQFRDVEKYQFWTPDIEIIGQRVESDNIDISSSLSRRNLRNFLNEEIEILEKNYAVLEKNDKFYMVLELSMSTRIYCLMLFTHYPLDKQTCGLTFQSFAFNEEELNLTWSHDQAEKLFKHSNNHMQKFFIRKFYHDSHSPTVWVGMERSKKSQLRLVMCFQRYFTAVFFQAYAPYTALVIVCGLVNTFFVVI